MAQMNNNEENTAGSSSEYLAPVNFGDQQRQSIINNNNNNQTYWNSSNPNIGGGEALLLDESNPSLVYDRTIKVAKTNYSDHGVHGVAAVPLPGDDGSVGTGGMNYGLGGGVDGSSSNLGNGGGGGLHVEGNNGLAGGVGGNYYPGMTMGAPLSSVQMHQLMMLQQAQQHLQQQAHAQQQSYQQLNRSLPQDQQLFNPVSSSLSLSLQAQQLQQQTVQSLQQQNATLQQSIHDLQHDLRQHQQQNNAMMPPPNVVVPQHLQHLQSIQQGGGGPSFPSLVPGTMGSQQFFQALASNMNNDNSNGGGGANNNYASMMRNGGSGGGIMNTTSSGLIEALNAQLTAQSRGSGASTNTSNNNGNEILDTLAATISNATGGNNNGMPVSNVSTMGNNFRIGSQGGMGTASSEAAASSTSVANNNGNNEVSAPGDIRNGKKRVSPSMPLHPSQLQLPHHGGGLLVSGAPGGGYAMPNSNVGMKSVAEEQEEISTSASNNDTRGVAVGQPQQQQPPQSQQGLMNSTMEALNSYIEQTGALAAAMSQIPPQPQVAPSQVQGGNLPQHQQQQQAKPKAAPAAPGTKHGTTLTNPSQPAANSGLDNSEGNLIVRKGDVLRIPKKNMHPHPPLQDKDGNPSPARKDQHSNEIVEYTVVSLLGQGTFAQVFHCIEKKTGNTVAVKIVKNKPAYTRQAAVEIDVFRKLNTDDNASDGGENDSSGVDGVSSPSPSTIMMNSVTPSDSPMTPSGSKIRYGDAIIRLLCYFMHCSHLCLVFEMLGPNLYELLKKRQFRGLPIGAVRTLVQQATAGIKILGKKNVVHCDLKPENILMVRADAVDAIIAENAKKDEVKGEGSSSSSKATDASTPSSSEKNNLEQWIKLIDFGSACFEGQTTHTYIQSRFYRSPEVLVGLPYDSAIDMWSLGCVAAELFLGLPILPGVHEHDQLGRILEMIGPLPDWMLEKGIKSTKFFKVTAKPGGPRSSPPDSSTSEGNSPRTVWEFKTRQEYINFLTEDEKQSKGGVAKLEQQPTNRYFKKKKLEDIVMHHGVCNTKKEREQLGLFVHFLKGVLDPDPWKRWTAHQASMHPFLTGSTVYRSRLEVGAGGTRESKLYAIHWVPPWDPSICRRKLLMVQKTKEKSSSRRRLSDNGSRTQIRQSVPEATAAPNPPLLSSQGLDIYDTPLRNTKKPEPQSPTVSVASVTSQVAAMADAMSLGRRANGNVSPPRSLEALAQQQLANMYQDPSNLSASLGAVASLGGLPLTYQQWANAGVDLNLHPSQMAMAAPPPTLQASLSGLNDFGFVPQPPPPPAFMGAQSFSGAFYNGNMPGGHYPHIESELGYALQRPGVFPLAGNDAMAMLQRQSSNSSLAFLTQQSPMLSGSWSNLSSTPRSYGQSSGSLTYQQSPGGILQSLGIQDQFLESHANAQVNNAQFNAGASLLAQQLADYSDSNQQKQSMQNLNFELMQQLTRQQSSMSSVHGSVEHMNSGSYNAGFTNYAAPSASGVGPMSLSSLPYLQSASFGDYGSSSLHQSQIPPQLMNMQNNRMQDNALNHQNATQNQNSDMNVKSSSTIE
jgi:dual specificity protein kinase YAK1